MWDNIWPQTSGPKADICQLENPLLSWLRRESLNSPCIVMYQLSMYPPCILNISVMEQKLTETNFARCSFNYMNLLTVPFTINII